MVAQVADKIEAGHLQLVCVDSVDAESWYNRDVPPRWRIARHMQYENYIMNEVVPLARGGQPDELLIGVGCSFGGYHAADFALRHPDVFRGFLSMSGAFDTTNFLRGYYDQDVYFHQPTQFVANMSDPWYLERYRRSTYVLATGEHDQCWNANEVMAKVFRDKGIDCKLDVWGDQTGHDWPWWEKMIRTYL